MFTDIVGYTQLTAEDEKKAFQLFSDSLNDNHKKIFLNKFQ